LEAFALNVATGIHGSLDSEESTGKGSARKALMARWAERQMV
jgi:hypothetical protein